GEGPQIAGSDGQPGRIAETDVPEEHDRGEDRPQGGQGDGTDHLQGELAGHEVAGPDEADQEKEDVRFLLTKLAFGERRHGWGKPDQVIQARRPRLVGASPSASAAGVSPRGSRTPTPPYVDNRALLLLLAALLLLRHSLSPPSADRAGRGLGANVGQAD